MIKKYFLLPLLLCAFIITINNTATAQVTITQWNFNQQNLTPNQGAGTAACIGNTTGSYSTGNPNLYAWSTTDYPAQSTANGTAGVQFNVSTNGYTNIVVSWENRNSNSAANRLRLKYTIDGTNWINFNASSANATNVNDGLPAGFDNGRFITSAADWYYRSADFSGIAGVEQNPLFAVKMVTEFADGSVYAPTVSSSTYETAGSIRFENVTFAGIAGTPTPVITSVILPKYMSGNLPANNRLPYAFRATISNLLPLATYRYINMAVVTSDNSTATGAGAIIYVKPDGTFVRAANGSFTTPGEYGEFTTDATGNFTGWFITEPTTNTRFTPGNEVFMRIRLNDGNNGTSAAHYLTIPQSVKVLAFATGTGLSDGTAIRGVSTAAAKNFAMLYDNTDGIGRPLFGTSIESTGIDFSTLLYAPFFKNFVAGINGSWGGIVPNVNANGVRRIEERSRVTGAVVNANTSITGVWSGVSTVNPTGGIDNVLVIDLIPDSELTANPSSLDGFTYQFNNGPSGAQSYTLSGNDLTGTGNIIVTAPAHYQLSTNNDSWVNILELPFANGVLTGQPVTIHVRLKAGLLPGTYNDEAISHTGGGATLYVHCSGNVTAAEPILHAEVVPMFIQGINVTNSQRLPFAYRFTLTNLIPNATYRYYNSAVVSGDLPNAEGAGVPIVINTNGTFTRITNPSMSNGYGEFTANAGGEYNGWFILEANADQRFTPGNELFMRLLLNNGSNGTTIQHRFTSTTAALVINFGTDPDQDSGTGIRATSESTPGNIIFLYKNLTGTGRPVYGTCVEDVNIATELYAEYYRNDVAGINGSWGGIVPNILPDGIRRIEERSRVNCELVSHWISETAIWGETDTRNPSGGETNELVLDLMPVPVPTITLSGELTVFHYIVNQGPSASQSYTISGTNLEGSGNIEIEAPAHYEISLNNEIFSHVLALPYANGIITGQPKTIYTRLKAGLEIGEYNENIVHVGGGAEETLKYVHGEVSPVPQPALAEVELPLYIQGVNGTNNLRIPFAFKATLINLQPQATYRYFNKAVLETDAPEYTGVGNVIYAHSDGTFTRTTGSSLGTSGQYSEFTTNEQGRYTGWFMLESIGNERFTPGNHLHMRIMINDGNGGTSIEQYLTTADFAQVLMFETGADETQGTAIKGISNEVAGNFISLYNSTTATRPLYTTAIESTDIDYNATGVYAPFFVNDVAGVNGSWAGIIPNVNAAGVTMIKVFSNETRSLVNTYLMPSGIWGLVDTRNPAGGADEVLALDLITINVLNHKLTNVSVFSYGKNITIQSGTNGSYTFMIHNMQGSKVASYNLSGNSMINTNLPAGIYIATLINNMGSYSAKVVIR